MKGERAIATYRRLREQALWRLLAADNGPVVIGLLETHLLEDARSQSASVLYERLGKSIEDLRSHGHHLPQSPQLYVADWLAAGYIERRFPPGATEEEYELSSATEGAIRFVSSLAEPRTTATESRLAVVMQQLVRLAEQTDANPETRIAALLTERARIDEQIDAIRSGRMPSLEGPRALERVREIIALADGLAGDFRRVRDQFEALNRDLRERIMDEESSRGEVLEQLFAGADLIAESPCNPRRWSRQSIASSLARSPARWIRASAGFCCASRARCSNRAAWSTKFCRVWRAASEISCRAASIWSSAASTRFCVRRNAHRWRSKTRSRPPKCSPSRSN